MITFEELGRIEKVNIKDVTTKHKICKVVYKDDNLMVLLVKDCFGLSVRIYPRIFDNKISDLALYTFTNIDIKRYWCLINTFERLDFNHYLFSTGYDKDSMKYITVRREAKNVILYTGRSESYKENSNILDTIQTYIKCDSGMTRVVGHLYVDDEFKTVQLMRVIHSLNMEDYYEF